MSGDKAPRTINKTGREPKEGVERAWGDGREVEEEKGGGSEVWDVVPACWRRPEGASAGAGERCLGRRRVEYIKQIAIRPGVKKWKEHMLTFLSRSLAEKGQGEMKE